MRLQSVHLAVLQVHEYPLSVALLPLLVSDLPQKVFQFFFIYSSSLPN